MDPGDPGRWEVHTDFSDRSTFFNTCYVSECSSICRGSNNLGRSICLSIVARFHKPHRLCATLRFWTRINIGRSISFSVFCVEYVRLFPNKAERTRTLHCLGIADKSRLEPEYIVYTTPSTTLSNSWCGEHKQYAHHVNVPKLYGRSVHAADVGQGNTGSFC